VWEKIVRRSVFPVETFDTASQQKNLNNIQHFGAPEMLVSVRHKADKLINV
jgi:hypothetical protein